MRLVPRSLFSRLVLVLLSVLVVAQLVSLAIHLHERGELLTQASGMQSAQRIADAVKLLDSSDPAQRQRIVQVLSAPPLRISLAQAPLAAPEKDADARVRAAMFGTMLRRFLGDGRAVSVAAVESASRQPGAMRAFKGPEGHGMAMPPMAGWHFAAQPGYSFLVQVRLQDGTLATFDSRQSAQTASWPYRLLLSLAVLLAAVVAVSLVAVRWATRPLNALADAAEELGKNIERAPLEEKGPLEVARAARAFNTMQARLAAFIRSRTHMLAAMSHDLKTPITRMRLRTELLEDPALMARFTRDLDEMQAMVGYTLDALRGLENAEPAKPVDIASLLESLQADLAETGASVTLEGAPRKPYTGKPQALRRCLSNLLDNAIKYGKSATVFVDDNDERLELRICDRGPGLPSAEIDKVFEPFYRVEGSRSRETGGTGLGLTIARGIAESHGGSVSLHNLPGGGLEARLTLPRRA